MSVPLLLLVLSIFIFAAASLSASLLLSADTVGSTILSVRVGLLFSARITAKFVCCLAVFNPLSGDGRPKAVLEGVFSDGSGWGWLCGRMRRSMWVTLI